MDGIRAPAWDIAEEVAGKSARQEAALALLERIAPKLYDFPSMIAPFVLAAATVLLPDGSPAVGAKAVSLSKEYFAHVVGTDFACHIPRNRRPLGHPP